MASPGQNAELKSRRPSNRFQWGAAQKRIDSKPEMTPLVARNSRTGEMRSNLVKLQFGDIHSGGPRPVSRSMLSRTLSADCRRFALATRAAS